MDRNEQVHDNSFGAGRNNPLHDVFQDDSASGDIWKTFPELMGSELALFEQFNENDQPNNVFSSFAPSFPVIPSPNGQFQFANLGIFNDYKLHRNVDSGNGNSSNNLSERQKIYFSQPNNNLLLPHTSPSVGMPWWNVGPQNLQPQPFLGNNFLGNVDYGNGAELNNLPEGYNFPCNQPSNNSEPLFHMAHQNNYPQAHTPHLNIDSGQSQNGKNCCRGIQESGTDVGTSSAACLRSSIAKESNRSPLNNSEINPISISHPRNDQFNLNRSTRQLAEKEGLPIQELFKIHAMLKELHENDGSVNDIFNAAKRFADSVANEHGVKLRKKAEAEPEPKRGMKQEIRNINAKKSNKRKPAKEIFLRGAVDFLFASTKTYMQEMKRREQEIEALCKTIKARDSQIESRDSQIEAQRKMIEARNKHIEFLMEIIKSRSNATGLPEQPPPDDSNGGNSGGDSSGRGPGPGEPSSRNTQAGGFNGRTFSNVQPSRDGSPSDGLSATTASRVSAEKLLTSSPDGNCVFNSRDNVQSSSENAYRDFLSEEHSDDDECDDYGESSDEGSDDSIETNYGKGDRCSESNDNERKACSTKNDSRHTSYNEKKDNWRGDCTEEVDSALPGGTRKNERGTADRSNYSSPTNNGECDDCTLKKANARVGCIESNDIGQGERKKNADKLHLNSTPSLEQLSGMPPTPNLFVHRDADDVPLLELPPDIFSQTNNGECDNCTMKKGNARVGCTEINDIGQGVS